MPWKTDEDVAKHKSGLTPKKSAQWKRIANSVLKREMKKGKTEKEAAASAIKQANGVVNVNSGLYSVYKYKQTLDYDVKLTTHQEKAHIVLPVTMMVEGVHNGSQGPLFHSIYELGKFPESWNGIPVVIYHPEEEGQAVSANSPAIIDKMTVGRVYGTYVDGKKLRAEVWLDEDKLSGVSPETLEDVNETREIEVSLGMFTENDPEEGIYEEEEYIGVAKNHRPDHLAILPDQIGACSCADGCGIGANKDSKPKNNKNMEVKTFIEGKKLEELLNSAKDRAFSIHVIGDNAKEGYYEKTRIVSDALSKLDKSYEANGIRHFTYCYLEEMYDDAIVYKKNVDGESKLYKQDYQLTSGVVEFTGEPVEVHREVEYVVNNTLTRSKFNTNLKTGGQTMPKGNDCPKCLEKINALIANKQSKFVETDREWLLTQDEPTLDKLAPEIVEVEKIVEKTIEVNKLSAEDQAALAFGKKQMKERKDAMVKGIQDNTENVWDAETLNAMSEEMLEKVFKSIKREEAPINYSVMSGGNFNTSVSAEEPLYPAGIEINAK